MIIDSQTFKNRFREYKLENGLLMKTAVSEEERKEFERLSATGKPLPEGVFKRPPAYTLDKNLFFKVESPEIEEELETVELLLFKQSKQIKTIHRILAVIISLPFVLCFLRMILSVFDL